MTTCSSCEAIHDLCPYHEGLCDGMAHESSTTRLAVRQRNAAYELLHALGVSDYLALAHPHAAPDDLVEKIRCNRLPIEATPERLAVLEMVEHREVWEPLDASN